MERWGGVMTGSFLAPVVTVKGRGLVDGLDDLNVSKDESNPAPPLIYIYLIST